MIFIFSSVPTYVVLDCTVDQFNQLDFLQVNVYCGCFHLVLVVIANYNFNGVFFLYNSTIQMNDSKEI